MDLIEAIKVRHSVRKYTDRAIDDETALKLKAFIEECNKESGLKMQLVLNDKDAFKGLLAHYGKFEGVSSYIALIGKTTADLEEKAGYYGEKCVLQAQILGLNSCWIALTFNKRKVIKKCKILKGEKLVCIISLGYGQTNGYPHKSKSLDELSNLSEDCPDWFKRGVECASLAPTALNKQRFYIMREKNKVKLINLNGQYSKIDLGIVRYHFEVGAGDNFEWDN